MNKSEAPGILMHSNISGGDSEGSGGSGGSGGKSELDDLVTAYTAPMPK